MDALKRAFWAAIDLLGHANWSKPRGWDYLGMDRSYCNHGIDLSEACLTCRAEVAARRRARASA
jgi:hypothetical protein